MIVNAINNRDYMLIQGVVLFFALVYGLIYLMTAKSYYHIVERR